MAQNDEFIREVDEEYRRDQLAQVWKRYSGVIVGVVILVVAAVGGWRYWEYAQERQAQAAAARYEEALRLSREENSEEARKVLDELATDSSGYSLLARFRSAGELGRTSSEEGAKAFDALAADNNVKPVWQDLARLRAAMLRLDGADPAPVRAALERLATPTNAWRHSARELLGLSGLKSGDYEFAGRWFQQIAIDGDTPAGLRQRLEVYNAIVPGGPVHATQ